MICDSELISLKLKISTSSVVPTEKRLFQRAPQRYCIIALRQSAATLWKKCSLIQQTSFFWVTHQSTRSTVGIVTLMANTWPLAAGTLFIDIWAYQLIEFSNFVSKTNVPSTVFTRRAKKGKKKRITIASLSSKVKMTSVKQKKPELRKQEEADHVENESRVSTKKEYVLNCFTRI